MTRIIGSQKNKLLRQELKDWDIILLYSSTTKTINQLYQELCEDSSFLKNTNKEEFNGKLIFLVMDKTLLLEILCIT
ncbi:hypothetical protein [uncultured Aquimarina sp.]|uniref:hypothetical protein n=1 Tax=uncultured Aquimarina sp. TaxID=575652 RepID=UPI002624A9DD|nr:hypothetical protein [uncultured Aquimarina sp.]